MFIKSSLSTFLLAKPTTKQFMNEQISLSVGLFMNSQPISSWTKTPTSGSLQVGGRHFVASPLSSPRGPRGTSRPKGGCNVAPIPRCGGHTPKNSKKQQSQQSQRTTSNVREKFDRLVLCLSMFFFDCSLFVWNKDVFSAPNWSCQTN